MFNTKSKEENKMLRAQIEEIRIESAKLKQTTELINSKNMKMQKKFKDVVKAHFIDIAQKGEGRCRNQRFEEKPC